MKFGITVIGSGSSGNSLLLTFGGRGILIDAGFSKKETLKRLESVGAAPDGVDAILITHEHSDHVKGAKALSEHLRAPIYATRETAGYLKDRGQLGPKVFLFEPGRGFRVGPFVVHPFRVPHDALDPVGFIVDGEGVRVGVATDLGFVDQLCESRLKGCDALIMESNHDTRMLRASKRPLRLIRRICGRHGHLSNDDAMKALETLLTERSRLLLLGHVSEECNRYERVEELAAAKLAQMRRSDIAFALMRQDRPLPTLFAGQPLSAV